MRNRLETNVILEGGGGLTISIFIRVRRLPYKYRHRTNPGTRAEPQQIVAQGLLSCLQYPVPFKSSTEDLTRPTFGSVVK